jgi:hypothetical protein
MVPETRKVKVFCKSLMYIIFLPAWSSAAEAAAFRCPEERLNPAFNGVPNHS